MIVKVIDGALLYPTAAERKKIVIANPTDDILKAVMGYKEEIEGEKPEYDAETQTLVKVVVNETEDTVETAWRIEDIKE